MLNLGNSMFTAFHTMSFILFNLSPMTTKPPFEEYSTQ